MGHQFLVFRDTKIYFWLIKEMLKMRDRAALIFFVKNALYPRYVSFVDVVHSRIVSIGR